MTLPGFPGKIQDLSGRILGEHAGHFRFTVGQRRGLGVAAPERLYVLSIDPQENRVVVGPAGELAVAETWIGNLHLADAVGRRDAPFRAQARVRHRAPDVPATVHPREDGRARVVFDEPVRAVAPGQSCVLYDGEVVLGGGIILRQSPVPAPSPSPSRSPR